MGIRRGDTPETSQIAKITEDWIAEFLRLTGAELPASEAEVVALGEAGA